MLDSSEGELVFSFLGAAALVWVVKKAADKEGVLNMQKAANIECLSGGQNKNKTKTIRTRLYFLFTF